MVLGAHSELWLVRPLEGLGAFTSPTGETAVALPSAWNAQGCVWEGAGADSDSGQFPRVRALQMWRGWCTLGACWTPGLQQLGRAESAFRAVGARAVTPLKEKGPQVPALAGTGVHDPGDWAYRLTARREPLPSCSFPADVRLTATQAKHAQSQ